MDLQRKLLKFPCTLKVFKLFRRTCMSDSNDFQNEEDVIDMRVNKRKMTTVSRSFPKDRNSSVILEAKDASTVIKNLNWEFKMLYGDLLAPKSKQTNERKFVVDRAIIQNQTVFPIFDPKDDSMSSRTDSDTNIKPNKNDYWELLLQFPLQNQKCNALGSGLEISEINSLRKVLEEKSKSYIPSVSKILEKTMPQKQAENLRRWRLNMIDELGEEGFQKYQEELFARGHTLHSCINNYLASVPRSEVEIEKVIAGHWDSLKPIFPDISDVKLLEERITHPFLQYKGILDCFARYKGHLVVIDWKTSKKKKLSLSSTFENPLQIAAYVGALNFDPKYQYLANKGLIVVAYEDGSKANVHFMDENVMKRYWKEWLARVKLYWELKEQEENQMS